MRSRSAGFVLAALSLFVLAAVTAEAQEQRFKLGGGAGFAALSDPDVQLGGTAAVGGFFGIRFNDNFSVESGFSFVRANRVFGADGVPVDQTRSVPAFRSQANRYHLDGSIVYNIGRRQPFHPFFMAGAGVVRRDEKRTDFTFEINPETGENLLTSSIVSTDTSEYEPAAHVGVGAEIYFLYNVAARAEFRLWLPQTREKRTRMFFFSASYYF